MWVYHNENPVHAEINDCVCRAISLATGRDYLDIQEKLVLTAKLYECDMLTMCCYRHLIEDVFGFEPINADYYTVDEFAYYHPDGVYLVRMNGHITTIINGIVYDIFDCTDYEPTDAWLVE